MMDRRNFVSSVVGAVMAASWAPRSQLACGESNRASGPLALPTADQLAWQDLELGMFVHFAPNTWQDREQDDLSTPLSEINPASLSTDQWVTTAADLGAKYIVFVAKHSGGFCMWQTHTTDYGIRNTPWRGGHGDVLADIAASCRKYGLKLGVYVSPRDTSLGADTGGRCKTPALQQKYNAIYRSQLTEVLSRYGAMVEVWFDGSSVVPVGDILRRYAPHAMIFQGPEATIRWVGNEDGFAPYPVWNAISAADAASGVATALNSDPNGSVWLPIESDVSILRPNWFWSPNSQRGLLSLHALLEIYYRSVGRGAQLLLNLPPDRTGLLPAADVARAREFGGEIQRRFGRSLAATSGHGLAINLSLPPGATIDTLIVQEDCSLGQRVRAYRLEAHTAEGWSTVGTGTSIGHKRIQPVGPVKADKIRLVVTESAATPEIRRLAVFDTGSAPPAKWNAPAEIWASDKVGDWEDYAFQVDLSSKIDAATQYRLRFVPLGGWNGCANRFEGPTLRIDNIGQPRLLHLVPGRPDELLLTLPAVGQKVVVQGRLACAERGAILMQKQ
jgi:alpha-L-fucosidase